ncbi:MAG: hypothetical protein ABIQ35_07490 [Verrucomicrobiota bacterium]
MKTYFFRQPKFQGIALCAGIWILFSGCKPITKIDIAGAYTRSSNGIVDTLILAKNGTFQQTITFTNGAQWTKSGSWVFDYQIVTFDGFYSAFDVDPLKHKVFVVIPPKPFSNEILWVEKDSLLKESEQPRWMKQTAKK